MSRIESIVSQLKVLAIEGKLKSRHAAAIVINGKILAMGVNNDRTYNKSLKKTRNTSICCSMHAEVSAIRKALGKRKCIL
jgi:tRNA(Arg) A34 adenosine deaminase TadA